ncbi:hypothetical protein PMIN04_001199 [Paraphaeosphaeria minitans]
MLREHGRSLVSFELHTNDFASCGLMVGHIGPLKEMTSLRHLKIVEWDFTGRRNRWVPALAEVGVFRLEDALPPELETLYMCLNDCYDESCPPDAQLFVILRRTLESGMFPRLREIKVERNLEDRTKELKPEIEGWEVRMTELHLWQSASSSGCMQLVIELIRRLHV